MVRGEETVRKATNLRILDCPLNRDFSLRICISENFKSILVHINAYGLEKLDMQISKSEDFPNLWGFTIAI